MAHVRLRNRETPKDEIECQIGETVDPKKVCPKCAYATGCPSYEDWLQYQPDKEAETPILDTHDAVHQNGESKWCPFCMGIRLKRKLGKVKLNLRLVYWTLRAKLSELRKRIAHNINYVSKPFKDKQIVVLNMCKECWDKEV